MARRSMLLLLGLALASPSERALAQPAPDAGPVPEAPDAGAPPDAAPVPAAPAPVAPSPSLPPPPEPAPPPPSPPEPAPPPRPAKLQEVVVIGRSRASLLRRSPNAVTVVDLAAAQKHAGDLGDVLVHDTPVTVQRAGGLGSRGAFSLGGLGGMRLRFFLDGVPLELMGYVAGIQNVPVNLVDRLEVYQGVVPVRFGADALGGAIQLVSDENVRQRRYSASYQFGDFGTHRVAGSLRFFHPRTGITLRAAGFFDHADNDYRADVPTYDSLGRVSSARLPLFHNGYQAGGVNVGLGLADKPWADRLIVSGFFGQFENQLEFGARMERAFGEVTFWRRTAGVNVKYRLTRERWRLDAVAGYAWSGTRFRDVSSCVYDFYGRCVEKRADGASGEINGAPIATDLRTDSVFLRAELWRRLAEHHRLRIALAPTYADRRGKNVQQLSGYDPLVPPRRLFTGVLGVELESGFLDERLKNIAFVKGYALVTRSQALLATGAWQDQSRDLFHGGGGDSLRLELRRELYAKASYEYAVRQPSTDELFGDGRLVLDSLGLRPEKSHNVNLGLHLEDWRTRAGLWQGLVEGFARWSEDLITVLAESDFFRNRNVVEARTLGVEARLGWTLPKGDWLTLEARVSYQDVRNTSSTGEFAGQKGQRIPNIPHLQAGGLMRFRAHRLIFPTDDLELTAELRYVHDFLLFWEGLAMNAEERLLVPAQLSLDAALTYVLKRDAHVLSMTVEGQNLTDARLFDFYKIQRPGRAFYVKWTLDW